MELSLPFGKKKKAAPAGAPQSQQQSASYSPAAQTFKAPASSRVGSLSTQGMSEPEIIRTLRSEGYTPMEVDSAMKQALRMGAVDAPPARQFPPQQSMGYDEQLPPPVDDRRRIFPEEAAPASRSPKPPFTLDDMDSIRRSNRGLPELPNPDEVGDPFDEGDTMDDEFRIPGIGEDPMHVPREAPRRRPVHPGKESMREIEEMTESIIDEKSDVFSKEVDGVSDEVKRLEAKLHILEERFHRLEGGKKTEMDEIKNSVNEYRETMSEVSARMESVERAMKDSMTPMMQTLRALSDAIRELKKK